jgi:quercetin dioxygenase-like cupin family protein
MRIVHGRSGAPSEYRGGTTFTGDVWAESVLPATDGTTINTVTFLPGGRTYWHSHERGQILRVVQGRGLVCADGGAPVVISVGDTVWVPPGERHWHGACPDSLMTHEAVSLGPTQWESVAVTDEEYSSTPRDPRAGQEHRE